MTETCSQDREAAADPSGADRSRDTLPAWLVVLLGAALTAFLGYGSIGLLLAIVGAYGPLTVLGIGTAAWLLLLWLLVPRLVARTGSARPEAHAAAVLAVLLAVTFAVATAYRPSEHVLIDQDPGFLVNSGRYLAEHDSLEQDPFPGAFAREAGPLSAGSPGITFAHSGSRLQFQGAHLTGVVLSMAHWVHGDGLMFRMGSLLGGAVLLAMFALASRVLRSTRWALLATALLAVTFPMWHFSRDIFSELPMMLLLLGGLWLLDLARSAREPRIGLVAGLLIGAMLMARVDALVFLLGLVAYGAIEWVRSGNEAPEPRRSARAVLIAATIGLVPGLSIGFADLRLRSYFYFSGAPGDHFRKAVLGLAAVTATAVVACIVISRIRPKARELRERWRRPLATIGVVLAISLPLLLWFVRPVAQTVRSSRGRGLEQYQLVEGVTLDRSVRYYEDSFRWLAWYVGAFVLILAIAGLAVLVWRLVHGRERSAAAFVLCALPPTLLYLWRPSATAIHPWVMRRFLMITFPLIAICAVVAIAVVVRWIGRRSNARVAGAALILLIVATVAYPAVVTAQRWRDREQGNFRNLIYDACSTMGDDAAVLILPGGTAPQLLPQTFRSFCDVPTVIAPASYGQKDIERLARRWEREGRRLWVVGTDGPAVLDALPGVALSPVSVVENPFKVGPTVTQLPDAYNSQVYTFALAEVPTP